MVRTRAHDTDPAPAGEQREPIEQVPLDPGTLEAAGPVIASDYEEEYEVDEDEDDSDEDSEEEDSDDGEEYYGMDLEGEDQEDQEEAPQRTFPFRLGWVGNWFPATNRRAEDNIFKNCKKLPVDCPPLQEDIAISVNVQTAGSNFRVQDNLGPVLAGGCDPAHPATPPHRHSHHNTQHSTQHQHPHQHQQQPTSPSGSGPTTRRRAAAFRCRETHEDAAHGQCQLKRSRSKDTTAAASSSGAGTSSSSTSAPHSTQPSSGFTIINSAHMMLRRELCLGSCMGGFSRQQQRHMSCYRHLPCNPLEVRDHMASRAYIGQYSADGKFFIAAFQDRRVRLYDTERKWRIRKDVTTRMTRWTITDTTLSPDQKFLVYSSISPTAYLVHVGGSMDLVESMANVTEIHDPLHFDATATGGPGEDVRYARSFGIWSISWSPGGREIIAGTNDRSVYLFDFETRRTISRLAGHQDDVNAVTYADDSPNIIISGSDDNTINVWDRRGVGQRSSTPVGVLIGHTEGLTHLCAKGDGRYLISNCKDQTIKLWDLRRTMTKKQASEIPRSIVPSLHWDYRWESYPAAEYELKHPYDQSVMTYRGHSVTQTLIRAYFSPQHSTGQRYIYAGSSNNSIFIWDLVTGKVVKRLRWHASLVRDCSWHPYEPELTSVSWDGSVLQWGAEEQVPGSKMLVPQGDQLEHY